MKQQDLKVLKRWLDKLLEEAYQQALTDGATPDEISEVMPKLKWKMLENKGIDPGSYLNWEKKGAVGGGEVLIPVEKDPYEEEQKREALKEKLKTELKAEGVKPDLREVKKELGEAKGELEKQRRNLEAKFDMKLTLSERRREYEGFIRRAEEALKDEENDKELMEATEFDGKIFEEKKAVEGLRRDVGKYKEGLKEIDRIEQKLKTI